LSAEGATPAAIVRPSAAKNDAHPAEPQSGDFSFYKAVGEKNANPTLAPPDAKPQPPSATVASAVDAVHAAPDMPAAAPDTGGYFVQVAAVTRKEDAEALVEALKKKQYPAFSANNPPSDKFYHVQVGPYPEMKDAEAMRARLIGDGYNPIVKK
jgi:DedD protein